MPNKSVHFFDFSYSDIYQKHLSLKEMTVTSGEYYDLLHHYANMMTCSLEGVFAIGFYGTVILY